MYASFATRTEHASVNNEWNNVIIYFSNHDPNYCELVATITVTVTAPLSAIYISAYNVETVERLFRRFRQVETGDSTGSSAIRAVSSTNQLVTMKARLQAGLSARLLELKAEMDKEFGMAFVDMESYLRTEKGELSRSSPFVIRHLWFVVRSSPLATPLLSSFSRRHSWSAKRCFLRSALPSGNKGRRGRGEGG